MGPSKEVEVTLREMPNAEKLSVSYVPGEGNPSPFYRKLGFVETGEW